MSNENAVMVVNQCPIQDAENNQKMALSLNAEAMETFKKFLRLEEVSDKTVIQYHSQIKDFLSWCYENHIDVVTATYQDILEYRNYLTSKDYAKTTKQSKIVTVRRFFKALQNAHMRTDNPADSVKPSKKSSVTDKEKAARIKYLSEQEIKAMLAIAAKSNDHTKVRNQAAIVLMGLCGLRGKEVVALQRKDIDIQAKEILRLKDELNRILSQLTGKPLAKVINDTERDYFMNSEQAKEYGIIDNIIVRRPDATTISGKKENK